MVDGRAAGNDSYGHKFNEQIGLEPLGRSQETHRLASLDLVGAQMECRGQLISFGGFEVDPRAGELRKAGQKVKLQNQPFQVLIALIERPGDVVTREELRQRLWVGDTFVDFDNGLNIAIRKLRRALQDDPDSPSYIETVPGRGYRAIERVKLIDRISGPSAAAESVPGPSFDGSPARWRVPLAIGLGLAIVAGLALHEKRRSQKTPSTISGLQPKMDSSAATTLSPSVAVLGFTNLALSGRQDHFSTLLAERMAMELAAGDRLRIISGEDAFRATNDLALPDSDSYAPDTLNRIRERLGADYVLLGSYAVTGKGFGQRVRLDFRLQDTRSGSTVARLSRTGPVADLSTLAARSATTLREKLGLATVIWSRAATVPTGVVYDGTDFWVAAQRGHMVLKFAKDGDLLSSFPVASPYALAYDGTDLWATDPEANSVVKLDASTGAVLGVFRVGLRPAGITFDGRNVWVANFNGSSVSKLTVSGDLLGTFRVGQNPHDLVWDGSHIWVTNEFSDTVTKLGANGETLGTYKVGRQPWGIVFDGANVWVANQNSDNVMKLNLDGKVLATVPTGSGPHGLVFDGTCVWALDYNDASVTKIQARTASVAGMFSSGGIGPQMAATDGVNVWVTNAISGSVSRM